MDSAEFIFGSMYFRHILECKIQNVLIYSRIYF